MAPALVPIEYLVDDVRHQIEFALNFVENLIHGSQHIKRRDMSAKIRKCLLAWKSMEITSIVKQKFSIF